MTSKIKIERNAAETRSVATDRQTGFSYLRRWSCWPSKAASGWSRRIRPRRGSAPRSSETEPGRSLPVLPDFRDRRTGSRIRRNGAGTSRSRCRCRPRHEPGPLRSPPPRLPASCPMTRSRWWRWERWVAAAVRPATERRLLWPAACSSPWPSRTTACPSLSGRVVWRWRCRREVRPASVCRWPLRCPPSSAWTSCFRAWPSSSWRRCWTWSRWPAAPGISTWCCRCQRWGAAGSAPTTCGWPPSAARPPCRSGGRWRAWRRRGPRRWAWRRWKRRAGWP